MGFNYHYVKTEFMIQRAILNNDFLKKPNIKISGHNIKQVSDLEFKYLGSIIAEDASVQKEIQTRIQKASAAFSRCIKEFGQEKHSH